MHNIFFIYIISILSFFLDRIQVLKDSGNKKPSVYIDESGIENIRILPEERDTLKSAMIATLSNKKIVVPLTFERTVGLSNF